MIHFKILVKTGDQKAAGTDSNVFLTLEDGKGQKTPPLLLDILFHDDLERGTLDVYKLTIPNKFEKVLRLLLIRDNDGYSDDWFCDYIIVQDPRGSKDKVTRTIKNKKAPGVLQAQHEGHCVEYYFPLCRWILPDHKYIFNRHASCLPQQDLTPEIRQKDLQLKREKYAYVQNVVNGPMQIASLPSDEKFSDEYFWTFAKDKAGLLALTKFIGWTQRGWQSLRQLRGVYQRSLGQPDCMDRWNEDWWFGLQRLQGVNPVILKLCKQIPEKFDVTDETVSGLIEEKCLQEALDKNKIFICDLEILDNIKCKNNRILAAPLALFYLMKPDELLPIAIQLQQRKGPLNPVFTSNDPPTTWQVAKMYYNNAEAQHHQGLTHLGLTHLLMEGVCICTHRNLSPSHPIFKLIAPHFLYLLAINARGLEKLISKGGWVDNCMTVGVDGMFELIIRGFDAYDFTKHGNVEEEIKSRGVLDPEILPYYPYRDDAVSLYNTIRVYVKKVVTHYYDSVEKLIEDWEVKEWRVELAKPRGRGGVGLNGIPGDDVLGFRTVDELVDTVTVIISTSSLGHSASNFQQYEQYAYVPNYPGILMKDPPTEKKAQYNEADILSLLPNMNMTLDIMVITKLLSNYGTNQLGNFEMQYLYDPIDVKAADEFRKDLERLSFEIQRRNVDRHIKFPFLDPKRVPNAISI